MNIVSVMIGTACGLAAAGTFYFTSMIASALFARSFYRIYARLLVGICVVMLLVPFLRWISPLLFITRVLLTAADYLALLILGYGVVRFNREFMKSVFLDRRFTAYFVLGTLSGAALVTLVFLHIAVAFSETGVLVGPAHYGPFLMLLAAMIFHTDYHLKSAMGTARPFTSFTFIGYAVSFAALCLSILPYFGETAVALRLSPLQTVLLENLSSAQTLLLGCFVFAALVWYLESVPSLYLLLLCACGFYHVVFAQWLIRVQPSNWALVYLPLMGVLNWLVHYFEGWERQKSSRGGEKRRSAQILADRPRFVVPFKVIGWALAGALLGVTLWTRFGEVRDGSPIWLTTTLAIYAIYYYGASILYKRPVLFYAGNLAAGLAVLLGFDKPFGTPSVLALAALSLLWAGLTWAGERAGLKREYRRVLADSILISASLAYVIALWRHLHSLDILDVYHWGPVLTLDAAALFLTALSLVVCAHYYRSRLPIYGALIAVAVIAPGLSSLAALLAWMGGKMIRRRVGPGPLDDEAEVVAVLGRFALPFQYGRLVLFSRALFEGALFFALLGLLISGLQMFRPAFAWAPLLSMPLAALVLGLLTRIYRSPLLYGLSLFFGYVSIHEVVQKLLLSDRTVPEAMAAHLAVVAVVSMMGWAIATGYSAWCDLRLRRVAKEEKEAIRGRRLFYGGLLHHMTFGTALVALGLLFLMSLEANPESVPSLLLAAAGVLSLFFGLSGAVYQVHLWTYLSLTALSLGVLNLLAVVSLPWPRGPATGVCLAALGVLLALVASCLWKRAKPTIKDGAVGVFPSPWPNSPFPSLEARERHLWAGPLAEASLLLALLGVLLVSLSWDMRLATPVLATFWLSAGVFALAAWMYSGPALTYMAAVALGVSTYPLLAVIGQSYLEGATVLTALALVLWAGSFLAERGFPASAPVEDKEGEEPFNGQYVYEIPLARCAAVLSLMAVIQGWFLWGVSDWQLLLVAYLGAALVLFLSAKNMQMDERSAEARCFVYLAGLCIGAAQIMTLSIHWGDPVLGVTTAGFSMVLACVGLVLLNKLSWVKAGETVSTFRSVYGEPLVHLALVFPLLAVGFVVSQFDFTQGVQTGTVAGLLLSLGTAAGFTFLVAALTYLVAVRATGEERLLHPSVILGGLSLLVFVESLFQFDPGPFLLVTIMVMSVLLGLAHLVLRNRDRVGTLLGVPEANCETAFYLWPLVAAVGVVLGQAAYFFLIIIGAVGGIDPHWSGLGTSLLACLFFFYFFYLERGQKSVHLLVAASLTGSLWFAAVGWLTVDVAIALLGLLWVVVAAVLMRGPGYRALEGMGFQLDSKERHSLIKLLQDWVGALLLLSLAVTVPTWVLLEPFFPNTGLTLLLVTFGCVAAGYLWRKTSLQALAVAAICLPGSVWATLLWRTASLDVMPQLGLVTVSFATGYLLLSRILLKTAPVESEDSFWVATGRVLLGVAVAFTVVSGAVAFFSAGTVPTLLLALTMALTGLCWLYLAWDHNLELLVYLSEVAMAWTCLYLYEWVLGVPFGPNLSLALGVLALSFVFFGLNILAARGGSEDLALFVRPTYYAAKFLPVALWWVLPSQPGPASLVIFAAASFYMMVAHRAQNVWALYVPALLYNVALYIWIPAASETTGLLQLYVIPAALTVLIFAHLHKADLTRQALAGIRIATSATILAVSTLEVLYTPNLLHFSVELFVTLLGIMMGVALRIRAFVYTGFAFLVIGVTSQLGLQMYGREGIAKAVILITVGLMVLSTMVFLNVKREEILQRFRAFIMSPEWE